MRRVLRSNQPFSTVRNTDTHVGLICNTVTRVYGMRISPRFAATAKHTLRRANNAFTHGAWIAERCF